MASQHVQTYLERHRIGALFEDLMAKVISDTPDEPIPYLIRVLKKMHTQSDGGLKDFGSLPPRSKPPRSMGLTGTPISRHSLDEGFIGKDHRSALARSWAGPERHAEGSKSRPSSGSKVAGREYPRPWLSGSKSTKNVSISKDNIRPRTTHGHSNNERPSWNSKTAVPSHDFDEWFAMQHKPQRTDDDDFKHYEGASSWETNGEMSRPVERLVHYQRGSMPQTIGSYEGDDDLEEELYVGKDVKSPHEENEQSSLVSYGSSRSGKLKARHAAEEHRRQLQALLMSKDQRSSYGNYEMNDSEDLHDDGTELLENSDELESEGVANIHKKGSRISKSMKYGTAPSETIRVSICARCAKIMTGQQSDQKSEVGSVYSASEVDDNFDSVSQVGSTAGLNRPTVWPTGFDSESDSSPRNGQHMWQSPGRSPAKGRHMFRGGSFTTEPPDSSRPPTASSSRSDLMFPGKQQRSWNSGGYSSDNDTEFNFHQVESTESVGRGSWNRTALESGSETDWYPRKGQRNSGRGRGFAQFDSGGESD